MKRFPVLCLALAVLGASAAVVLPRAERALALRLAADDPARLADLRLAEAFDADAAAREIATALAGDDIELAESFVALAEARGVGLPADLLERVAAERSAKRGFVRNAMRFGRGFVTGEPDGYAGIAGAATGDLLVYGDVRDLAREGSRWVRGENADPLMVGLATVGLAVTAGTYLSDGAAAPVRMGLSLFKTARRAGKIGVNLAADMVRVVRSGRGARAATALADLGTIEAKAGARTALDGLRHADDLADLTRVSRLAQKNGRSTLAILKTLGRGALAVGAGALTASLWVMGAATNIFLLVITLCTIFAVLVRRLWPVVRYAATAAATVR
jgi:hypothetical protein